jgi:holo-[acyl-carrier protein] synthase
VTIGLDLLEIDRMKRIVANPAILDRMFLPEEREYILSKRIGAAQTAAGLFCAKEAIAKATQLPLLSVLRTVCVHHDIHGKPYVDLPGISLSITHTSTTAAAVAICETQL